MSHIVEVSISKAPSVVEMTNSILSLSGALTVFWCPQPTEGKRYNGHAHLDFPIGVVEPLRGPIYDLKTGNE